MKHNFTLDISTEGSFKVKRRTIAHTSQSLVHNEQIEEVSSSFHITVEDDTLLDAETTNEEVDEQSNQYTTDNTWLYSLKVSHSFSLLPTHP